MSTVEFASATDRMLSHRPSMTRLCRTISGGKEIMPGGRFVALTGVRRLADEKNRGPGFADVGLFQRIERLMVDVGN